MATSVLQLDSIEKNEGDARRAIRTIAPLHAHDSYYDQQWLEEQEHLGRPTMATLTLDPLVIPSSPSSEAIDTTSQHPSGNNDEDTLASADGGDEFEQIRKRLDDRQREEFAGSAANGLFFGGGYIAKRRRTSTGRNQSQGRLAMTPATGSRPSLVLNRPQFFRWLKPTRQHCAVEKRARVNTALETTNFNPAKNKAPVRTTSRPLFTRVISLTACSPSARMATTPGPLLSWDGTSPPCRSRSRSSACRTPGGSWSCSSRTAR